MRFGEYLNMTVTSPSLGTVSFTPPTSRSCSTADNSAEKDHFSDKPLLTSRIRA